MIEPGLDTENQLVPGWLTRQVQALFAEARRRRRRRRLTFAMVTLASAALVVAVTAGYVSGGQHRRSGLEPGRTVFSRAPQFGLPKAFVAWFGTDGSLRIGNVATLAERRVARLAQAPCCRTVLAGQAIYWAGQAGNRGIVQRYDLATKKISTVAPGWSVFPAGNGRDVYIAQTSRRLLMLPGGASGRARTLITPPGWDVVPLPWAVSGGLLLSHGSRLQAIGLWRPGSAKVRVFGHGFVLAAWTPPAGGSGLIAWQPVRCPAIRCPIEITRTGTWRTLTVRAPAGTGFLGQGNNAAFAPDGTTLAAFTGAGGRHPEGVGRFVPALINTATGAVRLAGRAVMENGEQAGWLVWLPGGTRLIAGPPADLSRASGYAIDVRTGAATRFTFFPGPDHPGNADSDISYGAVVVPRAAGR